jgi:GT2 family glycosyltransferase
MSKTTKTAIPLVYVLMRNHNAYDLCKESIASLVNMTYKNFKILLIDDGSDDNSAARIIKEFPKCELLKTKKYVEYCKSFNLGIKYAIKKGSKYVFLVNNDTKDFSKNLLDKVVETFQKDAKIGLVGPLCLDYEKNIRLSSVPRYRFGYKTDTAAEGHVISVEALKKVGLLNERLYRYFEDLDLIIRLRDAGYKTVSIRSVSFAHLGGGTSSKQLFIPNYYRARNIPLIIKRYCRHKSLKDKIGYFNKHINVHIGSLIEYTKRGRIIKATGLVIFCTMGLLAGLIMPWKDNEK